MNIIYKIKALITGSFLVFSLLACQEHTTTSVMVSPQEIGAQNNGRTPHGTFQMQGLRIQKLLIESRKNGTLTLSRFNTILTNGLESTSRTIQVEDAGKGCKIKKIRTTLPGIYQEFAEVVYEPVNRIRYIDFKYPEIPDSDGRMVFTYSADKKTVTLNYVFSDGYVMEYEDKIRLNDKGYAIEWYHDLTNYYYDKPYTQKIEYNSAGYPIRFVEEIEGQKVYDDSILYTKEGNFDKSIEVASGNTYYYTNDLTRKAKVSISGSPFWTDLSKFYGENNPNPWVKIEGKDKAGASFMNFELDYTYNSEGYPVKLARKENGSVAVVLDNFLYDCKNYTYSAPRSWK